MRLGQVPFQSPHSHCLATLQASQCLPRPTLPAPSTFLGLPIADLFPMGLFLHRNLIIASQQVTKERRTRSSQGMTCPAIRSPKAMRPSHIPPYRLQNRGSKFLKPRAFSRVSWMGALEQILPSSLRQQRTAERLSSQMRLQRIKLHSIPLRVLIWLHQASHFHQGLSHPSRGRSTKAAVRSQPLVHSYFSLLL